MEHTETLPALNAINKTLLSILGVLEVNQDLVKENMRLRQDSAAPQIIPEPEKQPPLPRTVRMTKVDGNLFVYGDTYDIRAILKQHGGTWESNEKKWKVPDEQREALVNILRSTAGLELILTEIKKRQEDYDEITLQTDDWS